MSRPVKLTVGVLLLLVAGLLVLMWVADGKPDDKLKVVGIIVAIFGIPGAAVLVSGVLPPKDRRIKMIFRPSHLIGGIAASLAGVLVIYLFEVVFHIMPRAILIGALLAVPGGLLFAGTCWAEEPPKE